MQVSAHKVCLARRLISVRIVPKLICLVKSVASNGVHLAPFGARRQFASLRNQWCRARVSDTRPQNVFLTLRFSATGSGSRFATGGVRQIAD